MILAFSIISALTGLFLLRIGIRGKQISPNPHCRKCRFDLAGLDLSHPTPCPECGTTLRTNTPATTDGLRKTRKVVLLASFLFLLSAATGLAWPKLSKLPSIQNINIYNYFPEALLTKLATTGDDTALQTFHNRLIPGEVSDKALQTLIDHAFALQADESISWDERWGDVQVYAMLERMLSNEELSKLAENSIQVQLETRESINRADESIHFYFIITGMGHSGSQATQNLRTPESKFKRAWEKAHGEATPYVINYELDNPWGHPAEPALVRVTSSSGRFNKWVPIHAVYWEHLRGVSVPSDSATFKLQANVHLSLSFAGEEIHAWTVSTGKQVDRSAVPIEYAKSVTDSDTIDEFASTLHLGYIPVPIERKKGRRHFSTDTDCQPARTIRISSHGQWGLNDVVYLADVSYRVGEVEIPFGNILAATPNQITAKLGKGENRNALDYFDRHQQFWDLAESQGSVDVILRPNPALAARDPRFLAYLDTSIIFRDVPLMILVPTNTGENWKDTGKRLWVWRQKRQQTYQSVRAEVFVEE